MFRTDSAVSVEDETLDPGTWIVPPTTEAALVLGRTARETGLVIRGLDQPVEVGGFAMRAPPRVGLWRAPNNIPGGWMMWLFEQYELKHQIVSSVDFEGDLSDRYDVIVLPSGTTAARIVAGLDPERHDESWRWAYGIGNDGWVALRRWVEDGGSLVAIGSAVDTVRALLDLPIESVLPSQQLAPRSGPNRPAAREANQTAVFYCPGALLKQVHDPTHPIAFGMPNRWPIFFRFDQAYRLTANDDVSFEIVSKYPDDPDVSASGWLIGDELLRNQANVVAFQVGNGQVVTMGSQVTFRAQTHATFKLLFNAVLQGAAAVVDSAGLGALK